MTVFEHLVRGLAGPLLPLLALAAIAESAPQTAAGPGAVPVAHLTRSDAVPATPCFRFTPSPYVAVVSGATNSNFGAWVGQTCGTPETVSIAISGLPAGVTASFSPNPVVVTTTTVATRLTVTAARATPFAFYPLQLTATDQAGATITKQVRLEVSNPISLVVAYDFANEAFWNTKGPYLRDPAPRGLQVGAQVYGDRKITYTRLPAQFLGASWEQTAAGSRNWPGDDVGDPLATIDVGRDADLYIGVDRKGGLPPFVDSTFVDSGLTARASNGVTYRFFRKHLSFTATLFVSMTAAARTGAMFTVVVV